MFHFRLNPTSTTSCCDFSRIQRVNPMDKNPSIPIDKPCLELHRLMTPQGEAELFVQCGSTRQRRACYGLVKCPPNKTEHKKEQ